MSKHDHYETLKKLIDQTKRKVPSYLYLDENTGQINEIPLSKMDSAASVYINKRMNSKQNPAKEIHDSIFH
jgi:hypothetical protein